MYKGRVRGFVRLQHFEHPKIFALTGFGFERTSGFRMNVTFVLVHEAPVLVLMKSLTAPPPPLHHCSFSRSVGNILSYFCLFFCALTADPFAVGVVNLEVFPEEVCDCQLPLESQLVILACSRSTEDAGVRTMLQLWAQKKQ